ncbi:uncharacterized protein LOC122040057 [Zingiber officinale]|uniref:Uncharacterized protein n=1 Tax=Zingiber officinale TaxID=94328 RepID=A0A8J5HQN1_ZINOF|nr:uncharacterized protein LOC122040057 [Zingiber officinale]KAG6531323.1 hypothetical protein ZIOFF_005128 [Zingiber officinale]
MEEDSIDSSESFISLSLSSKGEQQELKQEDSHEEEKAAAGQNDGLPKEGGGDAGEESSGGGIASKLISNLSISVPDQSAGDEPEKEQSKEEKDSTSAGLFTHLLPKLPVAWPDEQSPTADEAFLLISIIED